MQRVILISATSKVQDQPAPARELYTSELFQLKRQYAENLDPDVIYVLSAKHGLVDMDDVIEPDETMLDELGMLEQREWARQVLSQLEEVTNVHVDEFIVLAEKSYRGSLIPYLTNYRIPTKGMPDGEKRDWLDERTP